MDLGLRRGNGGHGKRHGVLSDYTWRDGDHLLTIGKAYSGFTDAEILRLTDFFKHHTLEDHGRFRTVEPLVIIEVAFNNIQRSARHQSGYALRFPRMARFRPTSPSPKSTPSAASANSSSSSIFPAAECDSGLTDRQLVLYGVYVQEDPASHVDRNDLYERAREPGPAL